MRHRFPSFLGGWAKRRDLFIGVPALILLLGALTVFIFYPAWQAGRAWRQAEQALEARDFDQACKHLKDYVAAHPGRAEGHFTLARALRRGGRFDDAARTLAQARRLDWVPEQVALEETLAQVQRGTARERDLDELAAYVRAGHPDDRIILEALVQGYRAALRFDRAGEWLDYWVEHFPEDWLARSWRAEHRQAFGHLDPARADYLKALELRPEHDEIHLRLGLLALANRSQIAEAEQHLRAYLVRQPASVEALLGLARGQHDQGDLPAAAATVRQALDHARDHPAANLLAGTIEAERGNHDAALTWLRRAEVLVADPQATQFQLALVLKRLGKTAEAETHERRFQALDDAKKSLDKAVLALLNEPASAQRQHDVGRWYVAMGQGAKAERYFLAALRIDPRHRASHEALADYYAQTNRLELAQRHREWARHELQ